jgi:DNA-binding XRE family transcriptional regulator
MYPNLDAEMARIKLTRQALAKELGMTPTTLSLKLNGKFDLSLSECVEIKKILKTELSIEYLFTSDQKTAKE